MRCGWEILAPEVDEELRPASPPTFSVVMPAYESATFIEEAIRSVLQQTTPPMEIIVVDDGSSDDLSSALAEFRSQVRLMRIPHAGESAARNAGIREARGEFVAFLDSDDVYHPRFIEALTSLATMRPDLQILTTDCVFEVDRKPHGSFYQSNTFPVSNQRLAILERCFLTTNSAVRRQLLEEIGGFDESMPIAEDWDVWLRLIVRGARVGLVNEPLATYRLGRPGQATSRRAVALRWRVAVLEKALLATELTEAERQLIWRSLATQRRRAALASALESGTNGRHARARWRAIAGERRLPGTTRLLGALGTLSPGAAYRIADRLEGAPRNDSRRHRVR